MMNFNNFFPFKHFYCIYFHYHLVPLLSPPHHHHYVVVHVHESFFVSALSFCHVPLPPKAVSLLSVFESVSILLVSSICSLDFTYE